MRWRPVCSGWVWHVASFLWAVWASSPATTAHPLLEDALDVVVSRDAVVIEAHVPPEEIRVTDGAGVARIGPDQWPAFIDRHRDYLARHLHLKADGKIIPVTTVKLLDPGAAQRVEPAASSLIGYSLTYRLASQPSVIQVDQSLLRELSSWTASCVLRIRQIDDDVFQSMLLTADKSAEFNCQWTALPTAGPATSSATSPASDSPRLPLVRTEVHFSSTVREYLRHGVMHILTGYDHLLFVSALVLAAASFWDLVKVVSAFTLAHTLTLVLSVFKVVTISDSASHRIVEPMIAGSIVFVALQNVFWPRQSRGWSRLCIAFGFGLFHGLGFAGGLQEAMREMPPVALWAALGAFSVGVELGHQIVVIPLFALLQTAKHLGAELPRVVLANRARKFGSGAIVVGGVYFLVAAFIG